MSKEGAAAPRITWLIPVEGWMEVRAAGTPHLDIGHSSLDIRVVADHPRDPVRTAAGNLVGAHLHQLFEERVRLFVRHLVAEAAPDVKAGGAGVLQDLLADGAAPPDQHTH